MNRNTFWMKEHKTMNLCMCRMLFYQADNMAGCMASFAAHPR